MQQQPMFPVVPSYPPTNINTEQIQKIGGGDSDRMLLLEFLEVNKKLILAILDNQNLGKLSECAQYQAQLQKNLMYLAAIADSQPPTPTMPPQMAPHPAMQQTPYFMQHPQAAGMAQRQGFFPSKMPLQFSGPHQVQDPQQSLHQQQAIQVQMSMRSFGPGDNGGPPLSSGLSDVHAGSKQDTSVAGNTDGRGNAPGGHPVGDGEQS